LLDTLKKGKTAEPRGKETLRATATAS
jgi:hypothetical protein